MRKITRVWLGGALFSLMFFIAARANAQGIDSAVEEGARTLYDEGASLMAQEKYAEACVKFKHVTRLIPRGVGARLALARCFEKLGHLARSWEQYGVAETNATEAGRTKEAQEARDGAAAIQPNLILVTMIVSDDARKVPGLSVHWDGSSIDAAMWGNPMPVEVGKHQIEASASLHRTWVQEITFENGGTTLVINVPTLEPVRLEPKTKPVIGANLQFKALSSPPVVTDSKVKNRWMGPVGVATLSAGVAGLVVGGVLGGLAFSRYNASTASGYCDSSGNCIQHGVDLRDDMKIFADGSTWAFIGGGLVSVAGVTLLIAAPSGGKAGAERSKVSWHVDLLPGGVSMRGVW